MLQTHFAAVEKALLAQSEIAQNSGHTLHKGTPREWFIREFLSDHLGKSIGIGTGEIIDCNSKAGEQRNQFDVVLYRTDFPKLRFGGGIDCFLAESVFCTIEVKSVLDEQEFKSAVSAAANLKRLKRQFIWKESGFIPPAISSFILAFEGPKKITTILGWLDDAHKACKPPAQYSKMSEKIAERILVPSPSIDGVFVLGQGFAKFDNMPISFRNDEDRKNNPNDRWEFGMAETGTLNELFVILTFLGTSFAQTIWDPMPYLGIFPGEVKFSAS